MCLFLADNIAISSISKNQKLSHENQVNFLENKICKFFIKNNSRFYILYIVYIVLLTRIIFLADKITIPSITKNKKHFFENSTNFSKDKIGKF